jgi:hypothetical protein
VRVDPIIKYGVTAIELIPAAELILVIVAYGMFVSNAE